MFVVLGNNAPRVGAIRNARVLDVRTGAIQEQARVVIGGDTIESVSSGADERGRISAGSVEVDASGLFLVPGLIDMHVHLAFAPSLVRVDGRSLSVVQSMTKHLAQAIRAGVTTVRDLGSPSEPALSIIQAREAEVESGRPSGARPIFAGEIITSVGGHGAWVGTEVANVEEMKIALAERNDAGFSWAKFAMASASRPVEFSSSDLSDGIRLAHDLGLKTAVHANFQEASVLAAAQSGCSTLEHGYAISDKALEALSMSGTALCPTLSAIHSIADNSDIARARVGQALVDEASSHIESARDSVHRCDLAGVPILAGTDAGVMGVKFDAIHKELRLLRDCGLSPLRILQAATSTAAKVLDEPIGIVEPGRRADLLLVRDNPLESMRTLRSPEGVIVEGLLIEP